MKIKRRTNLFPEIKEIFRKCGYIQIEKVRNPQTKEFVELTDRYYTSAKTGKIYRAIDGRKLKELKDESKDPYNKVRLVTAIGTIIQLRTHKIIAGLFLPEDTNKPIIHHINRNKHDNRLLNLQRATYQFNAQDREKAKKEAKEGVTN